MRLPLLLLAGCELFVAVPQTKLAPCTSAAECAAPTPACDRASFTCVECVADTDCPEGRPLCDQHACRRCGDDSECASTVCMPDGRCASGVLFAASDGMGSTCDAAAPCTLDTAAAQLSPATGVIKLAPGMYERAAALSFGASVALSGPGATLHAAPGVTPMLAIHAAALLLDRVVLDGDTSTAVQCSASGVLALHQVAIPRAVAGITSDSCAIAIDRSVIANASLYGITATGGTLAIVNSFVVRNGASGGQGAGGVVMNSPSGATIELTTIADNTGIGLSCSSVSALVHDDVIYGNPIDATCTITFSDVDPTYVGGTSNVAIAPMFVMPGSDYHLAPGSPLRGLADPAAAPGIDFDGEPRPQPAATPPEPGADEIP